MDHNPSEPLQSAKPGKLTAIASKVARNPVQLRALLMVGIFGGWYVFVSMPMTAEIDDTGNKTARERKRLDLALDVERLRDQVGRFEGRLPKNTDPNEWVQYMMAGVRRFPLRQAGLDTEGVKDLGPYKVVVLKLQVEGAFHDVDAFLRWVEGNERLLRVDQFKADPSRASPGKVDVTMQILGVMG